MQQIKVYVAAKRRHAVKLAALNVDGIHVNARWIDLAILERDRSRKKPVTQWQQENFDDIAAAHFFVLYLEPGDELEGGLWEAGWACGVGKKIWIAGDGHGVEVEPPDAPGTFLRLPHRGILPWCNYRQQVRVVLSIESAFESIKREALPRTLLRSDGSPFTERSEDIFSPVARRNTAVTGQE